MSTKPKSKAIERLQRALVAIPDLKSQRRGSPEFEKWHRNTQVAIGKTFPESARHLKDFTDVGYSLRVVSSVTPDSQYQKAYVRGLERAESVLQSMIEEVEEYWEDEAKVPAPADNSTPEAAEKRDLFIIHGRDNETKETVARFVEQLGLKPVILHEQPNKGRTVIEKFERHAQVAFAIALLTPDDVGALAESPGDLKPRARQNVVLELGYFMGALGRQNVCALVKENVEIPSDISGVVFIPLDVGGAWRMAVVKELKASGFDVDANLAF